MHPAKSVIFFTTASGAGYGLLIWLGVFSALGMVPPDPGFGFVAMLIALGLITAGLISSTYHLGHPERAWRALSQWRTSWLSREGVAAAATYAPAGIFGIAWVFFGVNGGLAAFFGLVAAGLALTTVYCTAMIYASLKTVRAWSNAWVQAGYIIYALMTGGILAHCLGRLWALPDAQTFGWIALIATALGLLVKRQHWRHVDASPPTSTAETATGLGGFGKVRLLEAPHTEANYLLNEMGYRIARKHAETLRQFTLFAAFGAPLGLTALALALQGGVATFAALVAVLSAGVGMFTERWLFFAEAKHVVTLYYGEATA